MWWVMRIEDVDKNFAFPSFKDYPITWYDAKEKPFKTYGIFYSKEEETYRRIPKVLADNVSEELSWLSKHTSGGRVRFKTNSPWIVIRVVEPYRESMSHMPVAGIFGFSLFVDKKFCGIYMPTSPQLENPQNGKIVFDGMRTSKKEEVYEAELFFPLYNGVDSLCIGIKEGSILEESSPYKYEDKPVLVYGASITQGGCASKPGDDYMGRLCQWLDTDIVNLGFSGNCAREPIMAEYLATLNPSIFIYGEGNNQWGYEQYEQTYYNVYETFRKAHKNTPFVFTQRAVHLNQSDKRIHKIVKDAYEKALATGDKNVYYFEGDGAIGDIMVENATVDNTHLDSLGFYLTAKALAPLIKELLEKN